MICVHVYSICVYLYMFICVCIYIYPHTQRFLTQRLAVHVLINTNLCHMCVCVNIRIFIYMYQCIDLYVAVRDKATTTVYVCVYKYV